MTAAPPAADDLEVPGFGWFRPSANRKTGRLHVRPPHSSRLQSQIRDNFQLRAERARRVPALPCAPPRLVRAYNVAQDDGRRTLRISAKRRRTDRMLYTTAPRLSLCRCERCYRAAGRNDCRGGDDGFGNDDGASRTLILWSASRVDSVPPHSVTRQGRDRRYLL